MNKCNVIPQPDMTVMSWRVALWMATPRAVVTSGHGRGAVSPLQFANGVAATLPGSAVASRSLRPWLSPSFTRDNYEVQNAHAE